MDEQDAFVELVKLAREANKTEADYLLWKCLSQAKEQFEDGRRSRMVIPLDVRNRLKSL